MSNEQTESDRPKLLKALISLRFFAAALIVVHHTRGHFGLDAQWLIELPTGQGVSFFFVLSGFVLTYVYKTLDKPGATKKFLIARLGRTWPLHLATLLLVFILFPESLRTPGGKDVPSILFANIFLIQGWVPIWEYYFSYNWLSWAISTEFAFYLLFPFLLKRWESTWHIKLFCTFLLALGTIFCVNFFQVPPGNAAGAPGKMGYLGLIYISPLGRLFEFTLGMTVATAYRKTLSFYQLEKPTGTIIEIIALGMTVGIISFTPEIVHIINSHNPWIGKGGVVWLFSGGLPCGIFGIFILVMAMEKGLLSTRLLSGRILIKLGDMSLAIFLLHQILFRYYQWRFEEKLTLSDWLAYGYYWALLLLGSYILMEWLEKPCRNIISRLGRTPRFPNHLPASTSYQHPFKTRIIHGIVKKKSTIIALLLFLTLLFPAMLYLQSAVIPGNAIDVTSAKNIADHTDPEYRDVVFGKNFILKGVNLVKEPDTFTLTLVWKSIKEQRLRFFVAIHILDEKGTLLSNLDYKQSTGDILVKNGTLWIEKTEIAKKKLRSAANIGIVIYSPDPIRPLAIDTGPRDWQGQRLLLHLPEYGMEEPSTKLTTDSM